MVRRRKGWWDEFFHDKRGDGGRGSDDFDESPIVEWDPIRCHYCGSLRKQTYGRSRHKPVRFHRCLDCGRNYRSVERRGG